MLKTSHEKIKIMIIIDFIDGKKAGGTENQLFKIIDNLSPDKYELYLLSFYCTDWLMLNKQKLNCNVKAYNYNLLNHKDPRNFILYYRVIKYIKKVKPDVVITFFTVSNILGVISARLAKVNVIFSSRRDYGLWIDKWNIYLFRFANRFVKKIISNSHKVKKLVHDKERYDISSIEVIYNGIDIDEFKHGNISVQPLKDRLGLASNTKVVGILANLRPMKRHKTFFKAAKRVLEKRSDIDFMIVGDGPLRRELENITLQLGIDKYVHFVGRQDDVGSFISLFDIGINCSSAEGLSNAIMEYMTFGIPCVVADAGGNSELIDNGVNGYTFELDNDEQLAALIVNLLTDEQKQSDFILKSREIVLKRLSMKTMINKFDTLFTKSLINSD